MKTFIVEAIVIEENDDEREAENLFCEQAKDRGFSTEEIESGVKNRLLEWRDWKLILIDG